MQGKNWTRCIIQYNFIVSEKKREKREGEGKKGVELEEEGEGRRGRRHTKRQIKGFWPTQTESK